MLIFNEKQKSKILIALFWLLGSITTWRGEGNLSWLVQEGMEVVGTIVGWIVNTSVVMKIEDCDWNMKGNGKR